MAKRRANGEGSITKRKDKDGKIIGWQAQYMDNQDKRRTLYGKTQQEVKDKLKTAISESDSGLSMDKGKITFASWIVEWLEVYKKPVLRPGTYLSYYKNIHNHIIPAFPKVLLKDLRTDMLQKFINEKAVSGRIDGKEGGLSSRSIELLKVIIEGALSVAVDVGLINYNVGTKIKLGKRCQKEKHILTREEQQRLESAISQSDYEFNFIFLLALYTGLRVGELLGLKLSDIDLEKKELHVRRTVSRLKIPGSGKTKEIINEPKTEKGKRDIPLPDFLADKLRLYIDN